MVFKCSDVEICCVRSMVYHPLPSLCPPLPFYHLHSSPLVLFTSDLQMRHCLTPHSPVRHFSFILLTDAFIFVQPLHPSTPPMCPLSIPPLPPRSSYPSSLCILDHFLSLQVSGPVEADDPSPGGAGPPHCLRSVSLSLCSRYAHSPHPVRLGGRGRGAGRPQVCHRGHLL